MSEPKCWRCYRRETCSLRLLPAMTLPWVVEAHRVAETEWERAHYVRRALRGCGSSPGYVEDWLLAGAMTSEDVGDLVDSIVERDDVDLALLCVPCRHYVGPAEHPQLSLGWLA